MSPTKVHRRSTPPPTQRSSATVAIGFVTGMLSGLASRNLDSSEFLRSAEISVDQLSDPHARVGIERYAALYNTVVRSLDDEGFALFSTPLRSGTSEFL